MKVTRCVSWFEDTWPNVHHKIIGKQSLHIFGISSLPEVQYQIVTADRIFRSFAQLPLVEFLKQSLRVESKGLGEQCFISSSSFGLLISSKHSTSAGFLVKALVFNIVFDKRK